MEEALIDDVAVEGYRSVWPCLGVGILTFMEELIDGPKVNCLQMVVARSHVLVSRANT